MTTKLKWKLAAGAAAVAAAAIGGVAISAAAHKDPAASSAGSTAVRQFGPQGGGPPAGGPGGGLGRRGGGGGFSDALSAAATYLGLSTSDLSTQMQSGKTLAQIADATSGKSAANLIAAMVAAQKKQIDSSVQAGTLTQAQATQFESMVQQRITAMVNGDGPGGFGGGQGGGRPGGFGGSDDGGGGSGSGTTRKGTV